MGQGLITAASRSHSDTPNSVAVLLTKDRPDADNTRHSQKTDINAPDGGIGTSNPSNQVARRPTP